MSRPFANESVFRAIAHPARRQVLDLLRRDEMSVSDIASALNITLRNLSPHLQVLRTSGLIVQRRRGVFRFYKLAPHDLRHAIAWLRPFDRLTKARRQLHES